MKHIILAITGASGAPLALRLLETLLDNPEVALSVVVSKNARKVFIAESGFDPGEGPEAIRSNLSERVGSRRSFEVADDEDMAAKISSGSNRSKLMIIAPCSMSTLSAIACGITMNLVHRCASVMLKEKRGLILVPRESPLSPIHLENMLKLSRLGVHIVPSTLAFYQKPSSVQDMTDFVAARTLDLAGISHTLSKRWKGREAKIEDHPRILRYLG